MLRQSPVFQLCYELNSDIEALDQIIVTIKGVGYKVSTRSASASDKGLLPLAHPVILNGKSDRDAKASRSLFPFWFHANLL